MTRSPRSKTPPSRLDNRLLTALPAAVSSRLLAGQSLVELTLSDVLVDPGQRTRHVFFPVDGFVSLLAVQTGGTVLEVGLVGDEGMIGTSLLLGVEVAPLRALVQGEGHAWRLDADKFRHELRGSRSLRDVLNRYLYVQLSQLAQNAACTRFHFVEARLARWLLMTRDRAHSREFRVTHEFLANMLGVRRAGVTRAAGTLHRRKLIRYSRGDLEIADERGLEMTACSCYASDRKTYARVLG
jgi:CRP-like cAMP-binding protein